MLVAKQVADFITITRGLLFIVFPWMGITYGAAGLPLAALTMIYAWASDAIDGKLARRSSRIFHTWIGDHDLEVDMLVSIGLLIYMLLSDYISTKVGALYLAGWVFIFVFLGFHRSLGMTFQAPIYGWFLWVAIRDAPVYGSADGCLDIRRHNYYLAQVSKGGNSRLSYKDSALSVEFVVNPALIDGV